MFTKLRLCLVLVSGVLACAQNQNPPAAPPSKAPKLDVYVRRFSAGATLSVLALRVVPGRTSNVVTTTPAVDAQYTTTSPFSGAKQRIGYGLTAQLALTEHLAVNAGVFLRRLGYKMNSDIFEGTDNPNTAVDERKHTVRNEDTRARLMDFPLALRYYGKGRHAPGARWFLEFGGAVRQVSHIKSMTDTTVNDNLVNCCDLTTATPARRNVRGFLGGAGLQFIDPVGIRVVPEVRYTRWMGQTFDAFSTATQRNQVEAMISLTF